MAIGRFSNETQYAKGLFYDKENDPMRKQALDILSSKLAASGKFILLEREDLDILVDEAGADMNKIGADSVSVSQLVKKFLEEDGIVYSPQKLTAILTKLINANRVEKIVEKRVSYFKKAEEV